MRVKRSASYQLGIGAAGNASRAAEPSLFAVTGLRRLRFRRWSFSKRDAAVSKVDDDGVLGCKVSLQDFLGQRILDSRLDSAFQWPRAVDRIEARISKLGEHCVAHFQFHIERCQALLEESELNLRDGFDVFFV